MENVAVKAALDFAHGSPTKERVEEFARKFGGAAAFWKREWLSLAAVERTLSSLQTRALGVGFLEVEPSEEMLTGVVVRFEHGEGLFFGGESGDLKNKALRCIAAKMSEYRPDIRYEVEGDRLREVRNPSPIFLLWEDLYRAVMGELCVRQCRVCGQWEIRGEGFQRASWIQHRACGNLARVRQFHKREKARRRAEDAEFFGEE